MMGGHVHMRNTFTQVEKYRKTKTKITHKNLICVFMADSYACGICMMDTVDTVSCDAVHLIFV